MACLSLGRRGISGIVDGGLSINDQKNHEGRIELKLFGELIKGGNGRRLYPAIPHPSRSTKCRGKGQCSRRKAPESVVEIGGNWFVQNLGSKWGSAFGGLSDLLLGPDEVSLDLVDPLVNLAKLFPHRVGSQSQPPSTGGVLRRGVLLRTSSTGVLLAAPSAGGHGDVGASRAEVSARPVFVRVRKFANVGGGRNFLRGLMLPWGSSTQGSVGLSLGSSRGWRSCTKASLEMGGVTQRGPSNAQVRRNPEWPSRESKVWGCGEKGVGSRERVSHLYLLPE
ncbi:hypothetical protein BHE74_00020659 [Ensete ventricosum]|nr:hypothetical protein BHE74_00020659 [Ensete ventricosum]